MILKVCEWLPGPITQQYSTYKTYVKYVKLYPIVRESRWAEDISFNWHAGEFPDGTSGRPETPEIPFLFGTNGPNDTSLSQEILKWHNMNKGDQRITILHEQKKTTCKWFVTCSRFFFWAIATCCQLQPLPPPIPHRVSWLSGACGGESRWIRLTWWHGNSSSQWLAGNLASTSSQALDPAILIYISMWWWLDSHYRGRSQQHVGKQHHFCW